MQTKVVDIHPTLFPRIPSDTRLPPGRKQSEWSKKRSVTFEEMIAAWMKRGGKAASSTRQPRMAMTAPTCRFCCPAAPESHGVFSVDLMATMHPEDRYWRRKKARRAAVVHSRGTHDQQSTWMSDPKTFPGWNARGSSDSRMCFVASGRSASVAGSHQAVSQVRIIIDHMIERPSRKGRLTQVGVCLRPGPLWKRVSQADHAQHPGLTQGQGFARDFFPPAREEVRCFPHRLGSNYPSAQGH